METIKNWKLLNKFCLKRDKVFHCRQLCEIIKGRCDVICPLIHLQETIRLMEMKNLPLGEAMRLAVRASIKKEDAKKLLEEVFGVDWNALQEYLSEEK